MRGGAILPSPLCESFALLGFRAFSEEELERALEEFKMDHSVKLVVVSKEEEVKVSEKLEGKTVVGI